MLKQLFSKLFLIISLLCFTGLSIAAPSQLKVIRISRSGKAPRVVFELTQPRSYKIFTLKNPDRLIVDFDNTVLKAPLNKLAKVNPLINNVRAGIRNGTGLRIVFELGMPAKQPHAFTLPARPGQNDRVVLDLKSDLNKPLISMLAKKIKAESKKPPRKVIVVIDPGHGGKDPGATGPRGTHEKMVVLQIAKRLLALMNKQPGIKAYLTRKGDYYVGLRQRLRLARQYKADLFISIHADAFKNKGARGASVYALSASGASSEAARWLAEKENASELLGGVNLDDKGSILKSVLLDLSQTAAISSSITVGTDIINALTSFARLHHDHVEQAGFVVLKSPDIPSILIETGFLSNPTEERNLRSPRYQQRLASAILSGVRKYYTRRPLQGTWFAAQRHAHRYVVARGDTLSGIAERFAVTVNKIKQVNRLRSNSLRIGQVLTVPAAQG